MRITNGDILITLATLKQLKRNALKRKVFLNANQIANTISLLVGHWKDIGRLTKRGKINWSI